MRNFMLLMCLIFAALTMQAQDNVVKLNAFGLPFGNISTGYERALNENMSTVTYAGFLIPRKIPGIFYSTEDGAGGTDPGRMAGFSVTSEFRFYTGSKHAAPHGFYVAPYVRYTNYSIKYGTVIADSETADLYHLDVIGRVTEIGGGVQLGYQWIINEHFAIDWFFFGPRIAAASLGLTFKEAKENENEIDWKGMEEDIERDVEDFPLGSELKIKSTSNSATVKLPFILPSYRFGLAFGYSF